MSAYVRSTDRLISARIRWKLVPLAEPTFLRQLAFNAQACADPHRQRPRQAEGGGPVTRIPTDPESIGQLGHAACSD